MSEKYVNYYVEIMTGTMQDAVLRNISLQASAKVSEEVIQELQNKINELEQQISGFSSQSERIRNLETELANEKNKLASERTNFESTRHQLNHIDTFRSELIKERDEHQKTREQHSKQIEDMTIDFVAQLKTLQDKIEYLQLSPAKRKKLEMVENVNEKKETIDNPLQNIIQENDGGTF